MPAPSIQSQLLLPDFTSINPEGLAAKLDQQLEHNQRIIKQLLDTNTQLSYQQLVPVLEQLDDKVSQLWGPLSHLHGVDNTDEVRAAYDKCLPKLTAYATQMGQNKALYLAFLNLYQSPEFSQLTQAQQQYVNLEIRDFKLAGVALSPVEQEEYGQLKQQLAQLSTRFSNQLMDATQAWSKAITDVEALAGLPESALSQAKENAKAKGLDGYL